MDQISSSTLIRGKPDRGFSWIILLISFVSSPKFYQYLKIEEKILKIFETKVYMLHDRWPCSFIRKCNDQYCR